MDLTQFKDNPAFIKPLMIFAIKRSIVVGNDMAGFVNDLYDYYITQTKGYYEMIDTLKYKHLKFEVLMSQIKVKREAIDRETELTTKHLLLLEILELYEELEFLSL